VAYGHPDAYSRIRGRGVTSDADGNSDAETECDAQHTRTDADSYACIEYHADSCIYVGSDTDLVGCAFLACASDAKADHDVCLECDTDAESHTN
jgi:hypothetical protein